MHTASRRNGGPEKQRIRASQACKQCSRRKIKCDAMQHGIPCSRCQMDKRDDCALTSSKRGMYDRQAARQIRQDKMLRLSRRPDTPFLGHQAGESVLRNETPASPTSPRGSKQDHISQHSISTELLGNEHSPPTSSLRSFQNADRPSHSSGSSVPTPVSISAMFAEFLKWKNERLFGQHGLILFGEPSPLTFALEDLPQDTMPKRQLHYSSESTNESHNLDTLQHDVHPSHLDTADIAYLQAKGAFVMPSEKTLEYFVTVFFTKFYPLYSIVEKEALKKALKIGKLPWILIHTVCFIGATFCDLPVIFKSGFDSRFEARKHYYTKAKLMFDTGYETGKVILLQSAIMLSFWGPHLQSYCNPCSWINIASTLAISLGLHRTATHSNSPSDKGLLRRLWWTLVVRDTFCSILLGRPFRINLSQCNTEAPNIEEFETPEDGFYQVQIGHLSLLLRDVVYYRFGPGNIDLSLEKIHANLDTWYLRIRISLEQWPNPPFKCSTAFELLYNYHVLLLYIESPSVFRRFTDAQPHPPDPQPGTVIESSAIMIASHAINLVSKVEVCDVPHELYPAFFVAGTVLYRQSQNAHPTMSQMSRAHLDNCRTVLNQIRESWDPGNWAMHIFDFLCSDRNITARSKDRDTPAAATQTDVNSTITVDQAPPQSMLGGDITLDLNWETMMNGESAEIGDYLLMPNFLLPAAEGWPALQL